eukprot:Skav218271  [mRNA]  locus=scaffold2035:292827:293600:- [translate_table: standard]
MASDIAARLAKLRQIVLQKRNKPRSVSPSEPEPHTGSSRSKILDARSSDYSDYSDREGERNSIWDADGKDRKARRQGETSSAHILALQVPPGQWKAPPGRESHLHITP